MGGGVSGGAGTRERLLYMIASVGVDVIELVVVNVRFLVIDLAQVWPGLAVGNAL